MCVSGSRFVKKIVAIKKCQQQWIQSIKLHIWAACQKFNISQNTILSAYLSSYSTLSLSLISFMNHKSSIGICLLNLTQKRNHLIPLERLYQEEEKEFNIFKKHNQMCRKYLTNTHIKVVKIFNNKIIFKIVSIKVCSIIFRCLILLTVSGRYCGRLNF